MAKAFLLVLLFAALSWGSLEADPPRRAADAIRLATFNIAMGLDQAGALADALASGDDRRLKQVAGILQRVRPDIVLLNEFDYDPSVDAATLLNRNYLAVSQGGHPPIRYAHHFRSAVNTGVDSGLDLDGDGASGGPGDAWGFGRFPGQYGMLVLANYPLVAGASRTFAQFRWAALPGARAPRKPDGSAFYPDETWQALRLSSKAHWDLAFSIDGSELRLLAHHPTPPVFDGPEDRNGLRNFDEIRFWRDYTDPSADAPHIVDDLGRAGGLPPGAPFVIAGDFNADPTDGDAVGGAIAQVLEAAWIDAACVPRSAGGRRASESQGGINDQHSGDPGADTADFNDRYTGNLRLDYLLPSSGIEVLGCGVFWPAPGEPGHELVEVSDHRLVWLDLRL
jgi:endonuclease/exonuclease/phosphatase family metal-dependent hydrolase